MKHELKKLVDKNKRYCGLVALGVSLALSNTAIAKTSCRPISKSKKRNIEKKFGQSPFDLIDSFLRLQNQSSMQRNTKNQNSLLTASFDISKIYSSNSKNFKSKAMSPLMFDWIRTQYFTSNKKNIIDKSNKLIRKNQDLFSPSKLSALKNGTHHTKNFKFRKCTAKENKLLGCNNLYVITAQNTPSISCKNKDLVLPFESKFYLTFSQKYGFKILDVAVSGKRVVLDSMEYVQHLKDKGFNKNAINSQLTLLSKNARSFKMPKKQISTKRFLAKFRTTDSNRMPSSL